MKKLLVVAMVLVGGVAIAQAGINVSIRIGIPLPRSVVIVNHPAPFRPVPVYVALPVCPPRVVVACPPVRYRPAYIHGDWDRRGRNYDRHDRGHGHRH
jgi:hypothetical protein